MKKLDNKIEKFKKKGFFFGAIDKFSKTFLLRSGEVEAVKVHYFVPSRYEVVQEFLLRVVASVDFCQGP